MACKPVRRHRGWKALKRMRQRVRKTLVSIAGKHDRCSTRLPIGIPLMLLDPVSVPCSLRAELGRYVGGQRG